MEVVRERMKQSYDAALERWGDFELSPRNTGELECVAMVEMEEKERWYWFADEAESHFDHQQFSRTAIVQWLRENQFESAYQFDRGQEKSPAKALGRWPWGDYTTEALDHLSAAANRFWVNYEPADNTTAPTNNEVSQWLQCERKVSATLANAIASILRPDGLPTGPRK